LNAARKFVDAGLLAAAAVLAVLVALVAPPRAASAAPASRQEIAEALPFIALLAGGGIREGG
jgi:hypothetical protein